MLETNLSRLTGFDCTIKYQSCEYKSMFLFSLLQISWSEVYLVKETLQKMCTFQINILMTKLLILCHWCFSSNFAKIFGICCSSLKTSKFLTLFPSEFFPVTLFCITSVWMSQRVINRWNRAEKSISQKEKTSVRSCHERQFSAQEKPYQSKACKV